MRVATRYGLAGIGALALLTASHWFRGLALSMPPSGHYLLGVLPNLAAAIAITFVLLSVWSDQNRDAGLLSNRRAFVVAAAISGSGLLGWEMIQKTSKGLVFDLHDMGATLVGVGAAALLFHALVRPLRERP